MGAAPAIARWFKTTKASVATHDFAQAVLDVQNLQARAGPIAVKEPADVGLRRLSGGVKGWG